MGGESSTIYRYDGLYTVTKCIGILHQCDQLAQDLIPCGDNSSYTFCLTRSDTQSALCNRAFRERIKKTLIFFPTSLTNQSELHKAHKQQEKKRKNDGWLPSGRMRQDQPKPIDYLQGDEVTQIIGIASCPQDLKGRLPKLIESAMQGWGKPTIQPIDMLSELHFPAFVGPSDALLHVTRGVLREFIPTSDLECLESMLRAREHVMYWKPSQVKVILLAESHAHTPREHVVDGPTLPAQYLPEYMGPREFIAHVNCLIYGENDCISPKIPNNKGSHQFWQLLGVCAYGYDYYASGCRNELMHSGNNDLELRLKCKHNVLRRLQSLGIWLLDTNVFGWYMTQQQQFTRKKSGEVTRKPKQRPPTNLKNASLVVSWELYTKHVIRQAAMEGHLKALIPIGKEVAKAVTLSRLKDVVEVDGNSAIIERIPPAPNAWVEGGYGCILEKLSHVVGKYI